MADFTPTFDNPTQTDWAPGTNLAAPATPTPPPDPLAQDPAYLAFKNALGLEQGTAERNTQQQVDSLNQQLPGQLDWLGQQNDLAKQRIVGAMDARGIYHSSETNKNLANQAAAYGHAAGDLQDATANRIAALQQALATQETGFNTRDVAAQQDSADRLEMAKQQAAINDALTQALSQNTVLPDLQSLLPGGVNSTASAPANLASFNLSPSESFIVQKESGGSPTAENASSGAFGIGQLNPSSGTLQSIAHETGFDPYTTDPAQQVAMMRRYIADRYGTADAAAAHERQYGWY